MQKDKSLSQKATTRSLYLNLVLALVMASLLNLLADIMKSPLFKSFSGLHTLRQRLELKYLDLLFNRLMTLFRSLLMESPVPDSLKAILQLKNSELGKSNKSTIISSFN